MKLHNTLFTKVTPHTTLYATPKKVLTIPISGNLGKGLTHEQYKSMLDNISDLQDKADAQRMDYDEYVDYNEKATVRSDYNIADITELAKSLERLIWELQRKLKKLDKWNKYLKQLVLNNGNVNDLSALLDDKVALLELRIADLEAMLNNSDLNSALIEVYATFNEYLTKIKNIERILNAIPYIITDIEAICNKADGGFLLKYKTVKLSEIDLDAELPEEEWVDDGVEEVGPTSPDEDAPEVDNDTVEEENDGLGTEASKNVVTEMVLASPEDMSFANLYADYIHFPELTDALESTKDAIGTVESSASNITTIFSGILTVTNTSGTIQVAGSFYSNDASNTATASAADLVLDLMLNTKDSVLITSVCVTPRSIAKNSKGGRSAGGLVSIHAQAAKWGLTTPNRISFYQYAQTNANNDSWGHYAWSTEFGITEFYVTVFGTVSTSGTASGGSSDDIEVPNVGVLQPSCSYDRTDPGLEPRPEPEPEPEPEPTESWSYHLVVNPAQMLFAAAGGNLTFTVTSSKKKTVNGVEEGEWIDVEYEVDLEGDGFTMDGNKITASANTAIEARLGEVTIVLKESNKHAIISLVQTAQTYEFYYKEHKSEQTLSKEFEWVGGHATYFTMLSLESKNGNGNKVDFSYEIQYTSGGEGWLTADKSLKLLLVAKNNSDDTRTATVVLTQNYSNNTLYYKVTQYGMLCTFQWASKPESQTLEVDYPAKSTLTFTGLLLPLITRDRVGKWVNWTVIEGNTDWCTLTEGGDYLLVQARDNNTDLPRSTHITLVQDDSNKQLFATVNQAAGEAPAE